MAKLTRVWTLSALLLVATFGMAGRARAQVSQIYVSPTGSDAAAGTLAAPVQTPGQAQVLARQRGSTGVTVYLRGGTYILSAPLFFTTADSGETWRSFNGETPVLSGGIALTGWTLHDSANNIWQASVPAGTDFREVWVNGYRYVRAISSAISTLLPTPTLTATGYTTASSPLAGYGNPTAIECIWHLGWEDRRTPLASATSSAVTFAAGPFGVIQGSDALHVTSSTPPYAIENAYEFLSPSSPGQFYLNKPTNTLYLVPRPADDLSVASVIIPVLQTPVIITKATGLTFRGLTFSHSGWTYPNTNGFPEIQTDTYATLPSFPAVKGNVPRLPACVTVSGGTNVQFQGCTFTHVAADALSLDDGLSQSIVSGCNFADAGGTELAVSRPSDYNTALLPTGITIKDNVFTTAGAQYKGCTALSAPYTNTLTVSHNSFSNLPYSAIHVGWGWGDPTAAGNGNRATLITGNRITSAMQVMLDGGGIYDNGYTAGATIAANVVTGLPSVGIGNASGYYLDDGSINKLVSGNVSYSNNNEAYHCNNNVGGNTVAGNYFDSTGVYLDGPGPLSTTPYNVYGPNQSGLTTTTLPASVLTSAGLEPAYGGASAVSTLSPGIPQGFGAGYSSGVLSVSVTPPSLTGQGGVTAYEVSDGGTLLFVMAGTSSTYGSLPIGTSHSITVRARDAQGNLGLPTSPVTFSN